MADEVDSNRTATGDRDGVDGAFGGAGFFRCRVAAMVVGNEMVIGVRDCSAVLKLFL